MIDVETCAISDVKIIRPKVFGDARGWVSETVSQRDLERHGIGGAFVQENQSYSAKAGTVRALHLQKPPHAQAKLVRVLKGKVFDVAVDLRPGSQTFSQHVSITLSGDDLTHFYIPAGFAHGFCTLTDDVVFLYKMDAFYAPESEAGFIWNDPAFGIDWPVDPAKAILSDKDRLLPRFQETNA